MKTTRDFLTAADTSDEADLAVLMRTSMLDQPEGNRLHWLREIELALDGYGGERHAKAAERIHNVLRDLTNETRTV